MSRWIVAVSTWMVALTWLTQAQSGAPTAPIGHADAGKAFMTASTLSPCLGCHGRQGEGGYGPDLAGRGLDFAQFQRAVRKPWGVMPAYTEKQVSDQLLADLAAYFVSLPKNPAPKAWQGPTPVVGETWREAGPIPVPAGATPGQHYLIATAGCTQCHGPDMANPRRWAGAAGADYAWFTRVVYGEGSRSARGEQLMGIFSRSRLPEVLLKEMWQYMSVDLGLRALLTATVDAGTPGEGNTTYSLAVANTGLENKGLAAEDVSVSLVLPADSAVVSHTGAGYQGLRDDPKTGAKVATWTVPRVAAAEQQRYTLTLSGKGAAAGIPAAGSQVRWAKPPMSARDASAGDSINVAVPRR